MKHYYLLILFLVASCGNTDMKKVELLNEFRILSIVTSNATPTPEVTPGSSVSLQLYVSDINGGGRTINGTTISCIDPGISFGAKVSCDHDPLAVQDTYTVDTNGGDFSTNLYTGLAPDTLDITVPAGILNGRTTREQFNGVGYITIFSFFVDGKTVTAFKRITATNRGALNLNPSGSSILLNGTGISVAPEKNDKLLMTSNTPESFEYMTSNGDIETLREEYQVAWFINKGEFDRPKSDINETIKYLGDRPVASSLILIGIVRDERGGVEIVRKIY